MFDWLRRSEQTLAIVEAGNYLAPSGAEVDFRHQQAIAQAQTRLLLPTASSPAIGDPAPRSAVQLWPSTSQIAAQRMLCEFSEPVLMLSFASARNPGGHFLKGAKTQEEELCRCSGLYPCLLQAEEYYRHHRLHPSYYHSDQMIYSPKVPFFRLRGDGAFLETIYTVSVISSAAPRANKILMAAPESRKTIFACLRRRCAQICRHAQTLGYRRLLLGAFGCGAYGNEPEQVAKAFQEALAMQPNSFEQIVFAIPTHFPQGETLMQCFTKYLSPC